MAGIRPNEKGCSSRAAFFAERNKKSCFSSALALKERQRIAPCEARGQAQDITSPARGDRLSLAAAPVGAWKKSSAFLRAHARSYCLTPASQAVKSRLRNQQNFASRLSAFQLAMRFGGFGQRESFFNSQFQLASADPVEDIACSP